MLIITHPLIITSNYYRLLRAQGHSISRKRAGAEGVCAEGMRAALSRTTSQASPRACRDGLRRRAGDACRVRSRTCDGCEPLSRARERGVQLLVGLAALPRSLGLAPAMKSTRLAENNSPEKVFYM